MAETKKKSTGTKKKSQTKSQTTAQKRAAKSAKTAKKTAAKSKVRNGRSAKRATAAASTAKKDKGTGASRWKEKVPGSAPQSARITDQKGPVQSLAARTSFAARPTRKDDKRNWLIVDAKDQVVGRVATQIATLLRGKHKADYTPNNDVGDFVVVINADKVRFTSRKETQKKYYKYTGYIGGLKEKTAEELRERSPERILEFAVKGMVPRSPLGRAQMKKLKIYAGEAHPHAAQNPVAWDLRYNTVS